MDRTDIIVIGAGLNGLVAAHHLAKAGKRVVVLEAREQTGGTMSTIEIAPGFRAPAAVDTVESVHPSILGGLGVETIRGGAPTVLGNGGVYQPDDPGLGVLNGFVGRVGKALEKVWTSPLPPAEPTGLSGVVDVLKMGWALRSLGKEEFPEALRFLPMCVHDVANEYLSSESAKALVAAEALNGAWMGPRSPGSAYGLVHHRAPWTGGVAAPPVFARGGPGAVTDALARATRASGGDIRTGTRVKGIQVENGRVRGVETETGAIQASTVVSALDPRTTLLDLLGPRWLEPEFVERVQQIRARGGAAIVRLALDSAPALPGGAETLRGRIQIGATPDGIERAWDAAKYGRVPERPLLTCTVPTALDANLAPSGKHVMAVRAQFMPQGIDWAMEREAVGDKVVAMLDDIAPGLRGSVISRQVDTPADLAANFGLSGGCLHHADLALDQLLYMRPLPGWYDYRMPVDGLYLCGAGTHPGGAGTGLPGRNAAVRVLYGRG